MTIQFLGAAQTVTGSKHLISTDKGIKILLDCGLVQGINTNEANQTFAFNPADINFLVLSHAHIDHSGLLPRLVAKGFKGTIFSTPATKDLARFLLMDSAFIQEKDIQQVNKRRASQHKNPLESLYSTADVEQTMSLFKTFDYHTVFNITPDINVHFTDTGHILGSGAVHLDIRQQNGECLKITFTGDIGRPHDKILCSPESFRQADFIICESTYGDKLHQPEPDLRGELLAIIRKTCVEKQGKLIVPAFAIDRTQEIIYALDSLVAEGALPEIPVFIDSPLAINATTVMKKHENCFNPDILAYIKHSGDAFTFPNLHYVSAVEDSKKINDLDQPCIIVSASGMAEAGRIKHHIKNNIQNHRNTILLVGYCSPDSLGAALKRGDAHVHIFGEDLPVLAEIQSLEGFSAHADYQEIIDYLACQNPEKVQQLCLVHGEYSTQKIFKTKLASAGFQNIRIPALNDKVEIS